MPTPVLPKVKRTKEAERGRTIPATGQMQSSGIFGRLWLISALLLAALLFGVAACRGWSSGKADRPAGTSDSALDGSAHGHGLSVQRAGKYLGVPIKDLPVGTWVLAENPETDGNFGFDYSELDAAELRIVRLRMEKPDGGVLWIERIEHAEFLAEDGVRVGSSQYEEYEDLGIEGESVVVAFSPCPPLTTRPSERHCLVTSKFTHDAANVLELTLTGLDESIGITANHPFWSEDRQSFIPAGELRLGERLLSADGGITSVASLARRPGLHPVYNLEIDGEHVYHVSPAGVLVHNSYRKFLNPKSRRAFVESGGRVFPTATNAAGFTRVRGYGRGGRYKYSSLPKDALRELQEKWLRENHANGMIQEELLGRIRAATGANKPATWMQKVIKELYGA